MNNCSVLFAALVLASLQQFMIAGIYTSNNNNGISNESPKPTTIPATTTRQQKATSSKTMHHHSGHQHFVGLSRATKQVHSLLPPPVHEEHQYHPQHQHHHHRHRQPSEHHHYHQQEDAQQTPWLSFNQELKTTTPTSARPTTTPIKATHKNQHLQHPHTGLKSISVANNIWHHSASSPAAKGQQQSSARQPEVNLSSLFFNNNQANSSSSLFPSSSSSSSLSSATLSSLLSGWSRHESTSHEQQQQQPADANRSHYLRSAKLSDRSRLKASEYTDEYYYDDDDVPGIDEEYEENENTANELDLANDRISPATASGAARAPHTHHAHDSTLARALVGNKLQGGGLRYLDEQQLLSAKEQDYADDEPIRSVSEEFFQNDAPGGLTEQKYRELGTLEAAQQTRDKYLLDQDHHRQKTPAELAREHMDRMKTAGRCSRPLPRVIHVSNETSKRYVPYCTILHRCGEDTGCCDSTRQVCAAKSFEDVPVYFFVIKMSSRSNKRDTEVLMLRNHTECHCVDRSTLSTSMHYVPRDKRSDMNHRRYRQRQYQHQHHQYLPEHHLHHQQLEPQSLQLSYSLSELTSEQSTDEATNTICRCPKHFDVFPEDAPTLSLSQKHSPSTPNDYLSLRCRCDCLSHNVPCRRLQDGEEGFAMDERKCIAENLCQAPVCTHGDYNRHTGRCPHRKNHKRTATGYDYGYG